jgi:SAM-dependent methyltransferase
MSTLETDRSFIGSLPESYQKYLVPLIFEPYAANIAGRVAALEPARVLEVACGTGAATRAMASALPAGTSIVATDLNQPMLDRAQALGTSRPIEWQTANGQELPFEDASFDVVVCQFGVMFFPDKAKAYSEARRVLKPGGAYVFNVWDRVEENEFADEVTTAMARLFPENPPRFLPRTPYGYYDRVTIARHLQDGGFTVVPEITTVTDRSRAASARFPAIGFVQGTPVRNELEACGGNLDEATAFAIDAVAKRFGPAIVDAKMQAHVITVTR